jgi:hypothetical protein
VTFRESFGFSAILPASPSSDEVIGTLPVFHVQAFAAVRSGYYALG